MFTQEERRILILEGIRLLRKATQDMNPPLITHIIADYGKDPYLILIACLLSLRARDSFTITICRKLFDRVKTPQELIKLSHEELEQILYPLNYYKRKAAVLYAVSKELLTKYMGHVPQSEQELLSLKGVGRKTATLVLGQAFDIPALCVDTHVHRISNRLGWVETKTVEQTEQQLKEIVPQQYWVELNHLLVMWGQNICVPISPKCSQCILFAMCPKIGVTTRR